MVRLRFLVLLAIGVSAFYSSFSPYWPQRRLLHYGVRTSGEVVAKYPSNHEYVRFRYVVEDKPYEAVAKAGYGNPSFDALKIGDRVSATYLPNDPSVALMGNIDEIASQSLAGLAIVNVAIIVVITWIWVRLRPGRT
ncbi:MAG TPA: DUF3592 domain-containing protein [Terriglobales bacterium]|jgi:hypothetical protein|nr:DUF3592 domain-containing protein [Terriglobales bacterium]